MAPSIASRNPERKKPGRGLPDTGASIPSAAAGGALTAPIVPPRVRCPASRRIPQNHRTRYRNPENPPVVAPVFNGLDLAPRVLPGLWVLFQRASLLWCVASSGLLQPRSGPSAGAGLFLFPAPLFRLR